MPLADSLHFYVSIYIFGSLFLSIIKVIRLGKQTGKFNIFITQYVEWLFLSFFRSSFFHLFDTLLYLHPSIVRFAKLNLLTTLSSPSVQLPRQFLMIVPQIITLLLCSFFLKQTLQSSIIVLSTSINLAYLFNYQFFLEIYSFERFFPARQS